jgi:6-phosphofructokinase 1
MRIGLLTGGGDCPGLNAVIRAVVRRGLAEPGNSFVGFRYGWAGLLADDAIELTLASTAGILPRGGTILGTSRTNPYADGQDGTAAIRETLRSREVDALIPIGGEDTLGVALRLHEAGVPIVGVPKTIDNDLGGTDVTFGFQTAVQIVTDAIDRLHTTAESHNRVMVLEVMGRHTGWIATHAGLAGGADAILVPERPFDIDRVVAHLRARHERGRSFSIVVVAEGATPLEGTLQVREGTATDAFGHARLGGIGVLLEGELERRTGYESRVTILGHVQRGGTPVAFDRVLATRFGVTAMDAALGGRCGVMVGLRGTEIVETPLAEALREPKLLDPGLYQTAELFFG